MRRMRMSMKKGAMKRKSMGKMRRMRRSMKK